MQSRDIASDEFRGPRSVMFVTGMPEVNSWNDSADAPSLVNEITFAGRVGAAEQSTRDPLPLYGSPRRGIIRLIARWTAI